MARLTYKRSGVDINQGNRFVELIRPMIARTTRPEVLGDIGGFSGLFKIPMGKFKSPVLVASTDGVGTKLKCATQAKHFEALGVDLVAMNVNDLITCGAEPWFFLDYFAISKIDLDFMTEVFKGIVSGCEQAGCALLGGETAEMPGLYRKGDFDLAGFAVGIVDEAEIVNGSKIEEGDSIIGCASDGCHSNGFSFIRKAFPKEFIAENADDFLRPTRIYVRPIRQILQRVEVKAMAHITGGGFYDNIPRVFPKEKDLGAMIHAGSWKIPRVFEWIQEKGKTSFKEMYRTFNMGIGFVLVVSSKEALKTLSLLNKEGLDAWVIGEAVKGAGVKIQ